MVYFIQNLNRPYEKFTFIFYKLKNFPRVFFKFRLISPISRNFLKFFPQFIRNSSLPEYFLKIFTLKICLNIAWKCYECTKNVLKISYKFFKNFRTVHKILSKRLEYLINFYCLSFSKIFRTFPKNLAEIFKASFELYSLKLPSSYTCKTFM